VPPLNLKVRFLGRPVKPVAFGLMLLCLILVGFNVFRSDSLTDSDWSYLVIGLAGLAAVVLFLGWWLSNQWLCEVGMLLVFGVHFTRAVFIFMVVGAHDQNAYQSLAVCVLAAGSYALERLDPHGDVRLAKKEA
jgi:Kef-type K+ transport system membrane component KefB